MKITCTGGPCQLTLKLTAQGRRHHRVSVASTTVTLTARQTSTVRISLNSAGKHLLAVRHVLVAKLLVSQAPSMTVSTQTVTFRIHAHRHHR